LKWWPMRVSNSESLAVISSVPVPDNSVIKIQECYKNKGRGRVSVLSVLQLSACGLFFGP
jgi:hypothetical protein